MIALPTTRHDYSKDERDLLNVAVKIGVIDAVELGILMIKHGVDTEIIRIEITEAAWSLVNAPGTRHADWCKANDAFCAKRTARMSK